MLGVDAEVDSSSAGSLLLFRGFDVFTLGVDSVDSVDSGWGSFWLIRLLFLGGSVVHWRLGSSWARAIRLVPIVLGILEKNSVIFLDWVGMGGIVGCLFKDLNLLLLDAWFSPIVLFLLPCVILRTLARPCSLNLPFC